MEICLLDTRKLLLEYFIICIGLQRPFSITGKPLRLVLSSKKLCLTGFKADEGSLDVNEVKILKLHSI